MKLTGSFRIYCMAVVLLTSVSGPARADVIGSPTTATVPVTDQNLTINNTITTTDSSPAVRVTPANGTYGGTVTNNSTVSSGGSGPSAGVVVNGSVSGNIINNGTIRATSTSSSSNSNGASITGAKTTRPAITQIPKSNVSKPRRR